MITMHSKKSYVENYKRHGLQPAGDSRNILSEQRGVDESKQDRLQDDEGDFVGHSSSLLDVSEEYDDGFDPQTSQQQQQQQQLQQLQVDDDEVDDDNGDEVEVPRQVSSQKRRPRSHPKPSLNSSKDGGSRNASGTGSRRKQQAGRTSGGRAGEQPLRNSSGRSTEPLSFRTTERLMTDRGAYIKYLELQLERVSASCLAVQNYAERMERLQQLVTIQEEEIHKLNTQMSYSGGPAVVALAEEQRSRSDDAEQRLHEVEREVARLRIEMRLLKERNDLRSPRSPPSSHSPHMIFHEMGRSPAPSAGPPQPSAHPRLSSRTPPAVYRSQQHRRSGSGIESYHSAPPDPHHSLYVDAHQASNIGRPSGVEVKSRLTDTETEQYPGKVSSDPNRSDPQHGTQRGIRVEDDQGDIGDAEQSARRGEREFRVAEDESGFLSAQAYIDERVEQEVSKFKRRLVSEVQQTILEEVDGLIVAEVRAEVDGVVRKRFIEEAAKQAEREKRWKANATVPEPPARINPPLENRMSEAELMALVDVRIRQEVTSTIRREAQLMQAKQDLIESNILSLVDSKLSGYTDVHSALENRFTGLLDKQSEELEGRYDHAEKRVGSLVDEVTQFYSTNLANVQQEIMTEVEEKLLASVQDHLKTLASRESSLRGELISVVTEDRRVLSAEREKRQEETRRIVGQLKQFDERISGNSDKISLLEGQLPLISRNEERGEQLAEYVEKVRIFMVLFFSFERIRSNRFGICSLKV